MRRFTVAVRTGTTSPESLNSPVNLHNCRTLENNCGKPSDSTGTCRQRLLQETVQWTSPQRHEPKYNSGSASNSSGTAERAPDVDAMENILKPGESS